MNIHPHKIPVTGKVQGFYTLERRKITGELVETIGPFKNLITDIGLERCATNSPISFGYVGTGIVAPTTADTEMTGFLNNTATIASTVTTRAAGSPYWVEESRVFRFPPTGSSRNITEVGVGWTSNSVAGLWSHALTVDGSNNPVTVTVLGDEFLDVTYTLRYYPPLTDSAYSVSISAVSYSFVTRLANAGSSPTVNMTGSMRLAFSDLTCYGGPTVLGAVTASISGQTSTATLDTGTAQAYVPASKTIEINSLTGLAQGNVTGGITALYGQPGNSIFGGCDFQSTVSPAIPKNNTKSLSLSFSYTWDRY